MNEPTIKIFNTADSGASVLKQYNLAGNSLEVCGQLVAPGNFIEVPQSEWTAQKVRYERLFKLGALVENEVPESYTTAKSAAAKKAEDDKGHDNNPKSVRFTKNPSVAPPSNKEH